MCWARMFRAYGTSFWRRKIWSDECYVYLGDSKRTVYITRRQDEEWLEECLVLNFQQSPVHIMVWGCIGLGWKGPLVVLEYPGGRGGGMTVKRYREQVLEPVLKELHSNLVKKLGTVEFMQDRASAHCAKCTKRWLEQHHIPLLFHPANSPDLNPIEVIWHHFKKIICCRHHH
jgi:hypothetical protein